MSITYNADGREFHLINGTISYILRIYENGYAGQLYFGKALSPARSYRHLGSREFRGFSYGTGDFTRFEYPSTGNGDFRLPAVTVVHSDGSSVIDLVYRAHRIYSGKKPIPGLPATYVESDTESETLEIDLVDELSGVVITLFYTIFADYPVVARHARVTNGGAAKDDTVISGAANETLTCAMSASLDLPDQDWELITLTGAWAREFQAETRPLRRGVQGVASVRGVSGSQQNPFFVLKRTVTDERTGEAIGFSLVYSGNFRAECEADSFGMTRVRLGINPAGFSWKLGAGESFDTPEAVIAWSGTGMGALSDAYHGLYRTRLARGFWRDRDRPVLINNWEGTYFDFDEERLLTIARTAQTLGVELFVLDDGWFGARNDDTSSLGDWAVNKAKLPGGIDGLARKVESLGMKFGLWIEPEMISRESDLFAAHPDWAVGVPGRPRTEARHQYVLDFSRAEIVDYIFTAISGVLKSAPISYVKWDMNRNITEPYSMSLPADRQGEFFHRYMLGVYSLFGRLTSAFPETLFESCSSGGARFDPGMLFYAPQAWLSDDSDAVERLRMQWGASLCYPPSSMGAHVSASPNHQVGRVTPIDTRAAVAFFGAFGFELDPARLSQSELDSIRNQIAFFKLNRTLFRTGRFIRLVSPYDGTDASWMVVSADRSRAIVAFYRVLGKPFPTATRIKLAGLDEAAEYRVSVWPERATEAGASAGAIDSPSAQELPVRGGDELMYSGLRVLDSAFFEPQTGDFWAKLFVLERVTG